MKRLAALVFYFPLCGLLSSACATFPVLPPREGEGLAVWIAWHNVYGRTDAPAKIRWIRGKNLSCIDPVSGKPGFPQWDVDQILIKGPEPACREGLCDSPLEVFVADHGEAFSETAMCHELYHAAQARDLIFDPFHKGSGWQPGGAVELCNARLQERGL